MVAGPPLPVALGEILAGKYRVERVLGAGGMGVVVAATHLELGEARAVKFMLPSGATDTVAVERFFREARAAARLKSGHVARVYDVGRMENGVPYIVIEYLEGMDLGKLLRQRGPLPPSEAVDYLLQACDALAEAHAAGIVHRDLKPANLFLAADADGSYRVKVLDFGISKLSHAEENITETDAAIGSPYHMSPEQMRSSRTVDHRTDIWSLGVILYQLVTGAHPFRGETRFEVVLAVAQEPPEPPSARGVALPAPLEQAILRCLEKDRALRFADVNDLAIAIAPFAASPETTARLRRIGRLAGRAAAGAGPLGTTGGGSLAEGISHPRVDGPTHASWGHTRGGKRPSSAVRAASYVGVAVVAVGLGVLGTRMLAARAPAASVDAAPPLAASQPEAPNAAAPVTADAPTTSPSATAASIAAPTADAAASASAAVEPSASPSARAAAGSRRGPAAPARVPHVAPQVPAPAPAPASDDPWGRGRK